MADVTIRPVKPGVRLELTWEEFEALAGSLAVAQPGEVVKWLRNVSKDTTLQDCTSLARVSDPLHQLLDPTLRKGGS